MNAGGIPRLGRCPSPAFISRGVFLKDIRHEDVLQQTFIYFSFIPNWYFLFSFFLSNADWQWARGLGEDLVRASTIIILAAPFQQWHVACCCVGKSFFFPFYGLKVFSPASVWW
jgi:hypothetical protein